MSPLTAVLALMLTLLLVVNNSPSVADDEFLPANIMLEVDQQNIFNGIQDPANIGYIPTSVPFDNPTTLANPVPTIPSSPDCTVRPQTVLEIKRMRRSAARIAQMIQTEVVIMEKRKAYIEQMTSYLNDRIRELNKVKSELDQEMRWIDVSSLRITELSQREKMMKIQDVMACLNSQKNAAMGSSFAQQQQMMNLQQSIWSIVTKLNDTKNTIDRLSQGPQAVSASPPWVLYGHNAMNPMAMGGVGAGAAAAAAGAAAAGAATCGQ